MSAAQSSEKPLDAMDRLADMAHFPTLVNAGATANILLTLVITYFVQQWPTRNPPGSQASLTFAAPLLWTAVVLAVNLTPVVLLRALDHGTRPMPRLREMNFTRDQHRFSDWVYLAASANMAFWILSGWTVFTLRHTPATLAATLVIAFLVTFCPVLLRRARSRPA